MYKIRSKLILIGCKFEVKKIVLFRSLSTMKTVPLVLLLTSLVTAAAAQNCQSESQTFLTCLQGTFDILKSLQSPDGRKDFMARKFCNMFQTMQDCYDNMDVNCKVEELETKWETETKKALDLVVSIPNWDTSKCPAAQRMLNGASNLAFGSLTLVVLVVAQLLRI